MAQKEGYNFFYFFYLFIFLHTVQCENLFRKHEVTSIICGVERWHSSSIFRSSGGGTIFNDLFKSGKSMHPNYRDNQFKPSRVKMRECSQPQAPSSVIRKSPNCLSWDNQTCLLLSKFNVLYPNTCKRARGESRRRIIWGGVGGTRGGLRAKQAQKQVLKGGEV